MAFLKGGYINEIWAWANTFIFYLGSNTPVPALAIRDDAAPSNCDTFLFHCVIHVAPSEGRRKVIAKERTIFADLAFGSSDLTCAPSACGIINDCAGKQCLWAPTKHVWLMTNVWQSWSLHWHCIVSAFLSVLYVPPPRVPKHCRVQFLHIKNTTKVRPPNFGWILFCLV